MFFSKVKICNMALSNIGARNRIEDIEENTAEAEACNLWYDLALEMALAKYDWSFARKRSTLEVSDTDPPEGVWAFRYKWPNDCVAPRSIQMPSVLTGRVSACGGVYDNVDRPDAIPFDTELADSETKSIVCNVDDAVLVYTSFVTNPVVYSVAFITALAYALAQLISVQLTGKISLKEAMDTLFMRAVSYAAAQDGNQAVKEAPRDAVWVRGRY